MLSSDEAWRAPRVSVRGSLPQESLDPRRNLFGHFTHLEMEAGQPPSHIPKEPKATLTLAGHLPNR
jgi:hypothetical protein